MIINLLYKQNKIMTVVKLTVAVNILKCKHHELLKSQSREIMVTLRNYFTTSSN